ncbi:MAG: glycoside hydrolase family 30 protein [Eubacterium sp.]|nr:glycoside hydrolase family 30 protein [Eubacterium sp.]
MSKSKIKKILIPVICVICVIALAAASYGAYFLFGVYGVETKRTYPVSAAVTDSYYSRVDAGETGVTVIDEKATYQTMQGFGASACWWAQTVGGWDNVKDVLTLLYDKENGIGLNIFRYNLGAGSKDDEHIYVERSRTESFLKADGTYDFSADANAQNTLAIAKSLAGDELRVTLFANSPPVSLTRNGFAYGSAAHDGDPFECNLDPANYEAYADYLYTVAKYFTDGGYRVTDVSPVNEPQYAWRAWYNADGSFSMNQEGCYYHENDMLGLYKALIAKFDGSELDKLGCELSLFESGAAEGRNTPTSTILDALLGKKNGQYKYNKELRDYFDTISTHSYWSSDATKKRMAIYLSERYSNYDVICTEYCQMTNDGNTGVIDLIQAENGSTNGMTIEYGTAMAEVVLDDLTLLNAKEWDWWTACSFGIYPDGLVYLNNDNHSDIQTSKRLWCLGNFSKFIDEGAVRIAADSGVKKLSNCAFKNPDGSTVIVYVNSKDIDQSTKLEGINSSSYEVYTTSAEYDLALTASGDNAADTVISVPAQSVVTVVLK